MYFIANSGSRALDPQIRVFTEDVPGQVYDVVIHLDRHYGNDLCLTWPELRQLSQFLRDQVDEHDAAAAAPLVTPPVVDTIPFDEL